jgi:hypothetical protein
MMKKNRISWVKRIILILLLVLTVLATSIGIYQRRVKLVMKGYLFGNHPTCHLPCWNNITPGVTTKDQALNTLTSDPYIEKGSVNVVGTDVSGGCEWNWRMHGNSFIYISPGLNWRNGVVQEITLGTPYNLTVQEIFGKFGPPETIDIGPGGIPEGWYWIVDMFYAPSGIQVKAYTSENSSLIEPFTEIGGIYLFSPTSNKDRISKYFSGISSEELNLNAWKGYGDLMKLYDIDLSIR